MRTYFCNRDFDEYLCCMKKVEKACDDIKEEAMLEADRTKYTMMNTLTQAECTIKTLPVVDDDNCTCQFSAGKINYFRFQS